ncbi:MAG TPA: FKBP-type peptidyl-prolyl cis-trans isomerase [Moraxellaceae bacterium]|nr:FKBP-type peptidyl-prolyl cis-trans isomerase [Moraxellaceae bacterium]
MKRILLATALLASMPVMAADKPAAAKPADKAAAKAGPATTLPKDDDKAAYSIGYFTGKANMQHLETLNVDAYVAGFRDAYGNKEPVLTEEEMKATLEAFKQKLAAQAYAKSKKEAEENKARSTAYLAENGKKLGVTTTTSGVQYEILNQGSGPKPKPSDTVKVHYEGKLIDGSIFDSSLQRGEPATFRLDQVIPGWTEALQLMPVGSKYRITLPPELAYGEQGAGPIPANATLIFEVELLGIEKPEPAAPATTPAAKGKKGK